MPLLTSDERRIRESVRHWVDERFLPFVAQHYRAGTFPMELVPELARLGAFGPIDQRPRLCRAGECRRRAHHARARTR